MEPLALAGLVALLALATLVLIGAERRESRAWTWASKPVASAAFVALGIIGGIPDDRPRLLLILALVLSFVGDLFLIPQENTAFRFAILSFLAAHLVFMLAFLAYGVAWGWAALALVPLAIVAAIIARRILPKVAPELKRSVIAYVIVITAMVALAAGAATAGASPLLLLAALLFWANDILVARHRFVEKEWLNRAVGLPMYYGAMLIFALVASGALV